MKDTTIVDTAKTDKLVRQIWEAFNLIRGNVSSNDFDLVLYLLILVRDGGINRDNLREDTILHDLIEAGRSQKFSSISAYYEQKIKNVPKRILVNLTDTLLSLNAKDLKEYCPNVFESLLNSYIHNSGHMGGPFTLPSEMSKLVSHFMPKGKEATIYNPFAGLVSFGLETNPNARVLAQEVNDGTWALGKLRLMAHGRENVDFQLEDSLRNWSEGRYDCIVSNPPFNMKSDRSLFEDAGSDQKFAEGFMLEKAINQLSENGVAIVVVPNSVLFRSGAEERLRKRLISEDLVEWVLALPSNLLMNTSLSFSIIVLNRSKKAKGVVGFVDASEMFTKANNPRHNRLEVDKLIELLDQKKENAQLVCVKNELVEKQDYVFQPQRYVLQVEGIPLDELIQVRPFKNPKDATEDGKFVRIKNLSGDSINFWTDFGSLVSEKLPVHSAQLTENSLLLSLKWGDLKPTLFSKGNQVFYSKPDIITCQVNESIIDPEFLVQELKKASVAEQVKKLSTGTTVMSLSKQNLLLVKIEMTDLPSLSEQRAMVLATKSRLLEEQEEKIVALRKQAGVVKADESSFLRHQIAGPLRNTRSAFNSIQKIIDGQSQEQRDNLFQLQLNDSSRSLEDYLKIIRRDLESIHQSVLRTGKQIDMMEMNMGPVNIVEFVNLYVNELKERAKGRYGVNIDDVEAKGSEVTDPVYVNADPHYLRIMFDNLVENAEKHAFTGNPINKNHFSISVFPSYDEDKVQVDFSNTGKPFPKSLKWKDFIRKGAGFGANSGDGLGGWYINEIMEKHGGFLNLTDETEDGLFFDLVTTFEMHFPFIEH